MEGVRGQIGLYRTTCDWIVGKIYSVISVYLDSNTFFVILTPPHWIRNYKMAKVPSLIFHLRVFISIVGEPCPLFDNWTIKGEVFICTRCSLSLNQCVCVLICRRMCTQTAWIFPTSFMQVCDLSTQWQLHVVCVSVWIIVKRHAAMSVRSFVAYAVTEFYALCHRNVTWWDAAKTHVHRLHVDTFLLTVHNVGITKNWIKEVTLLEKILQYSILAKEL